MKESVKWFAYIGPPEKITVPRGVIPESARRWDAGRWPSCNQKAMSTSTVNQLQSDEQSTANNEVYSGGEECRPNLNGDDLPWLDCSEVADKRGDAQ
jgi:hypothetical protein